MAIRQIQFNSKIPMFHPRSRSSRCMLHANASETRHQIYLIASFATEFLQIFLIPITTATFVSKKQEFFRCIVSRVPNFSSPIAPYLWYTHVHQKYTVLLKCQFMFFLLLGVPPRNVLENFTHYHAIPPYSCDCNTFPIASLKLSKNHICIKLCHYFYFPKNNFSDTQICCLQHLYSFFCCRYWRFNEHVGCSNVPCSNERN